MSQRRTVVPPTQASGQSELPLVSPRASESPPSEAPRPAPEVSEALEHAFAAGTRVDWARLGVALLVCLAIVIGAVVLV